MKPESHSQKPLGRQCELRGQGSKRLMGIGVCEKFQGGSHCLFIELTIGIRSISPSSIGLICQIQLYLKSLSGNFQEKHSKRCIMIVRINYFIYFTVLQMGPCSSGQQKVPKQEKTNKKEVNYEFYQDQAMFGDELLFEVPEKDMSLPLHRHIGALLFKKDVEGRKSYGKGSGILISPNLVLTAAHNLCLQTTREEYHHLRFYPGHSGDMHDCYNISSVFIPPRYFLTNKPKHDFALLKLDRNVETNDFIPLCTNLQGINEIEKIAIYGYPADSYTKWGPQENDLRINQWGLTRAEKVKQFSEQKGHILHFLSTKPGQSGAPIIGIDKNKKLSIIGVHKGGLLTNKGKVNIIKDQECNGHKDKVQFRANVGKLITPETIAILSRQCKKMGAEMFNTSDSNKKQDKMTPVEEQIEKYFEQGSLHCEKKQYDEAIQVLTKITEINPEDAQVWFNIGVMWQKKKIYKRAISSYKKAIQIDSNYYEAYINLGKSFSNMKNYEDSIYYSFIALQFNPNSAKVCTNIGVAFQKNNDTDKAIEYLEKAIEIDSSYSNPYFNLGTIFNKKGENKKALQYYDKYYEINPEEQLSKTVLSLRNKQSHEN